MTKKLTVAVIVAGIFAGILPAQRRLGGGNVEETTRVINDCEKRTNSFKGTLHRALNKSAINHTAREDQLNRDADRLENAMDKVGDSWNRDHNAQKTKGYVSGAIAVGQDINRTMVSWHLDPDVERDWAAVRSELNRLAQVFRLPSIRW
jgi:hypothetical protein